MKVRFVRYAGAAYALIETNEGWHLDVQVNTCDAAGIRRAAQAMQERADSYARQAQRALAAADAAIAQVTGEQS